jgi:hypothetical protein
MAKLMKLARTRQHGDLCLQLGAATLALLLATGCGEGAAAAPSLRDDPQLTLAEPSFATPDGTLEDYGLSCRAEISNGQFHVHVQNDSAEEVDFLGWGTPWDKYSDVLRVRSLATGHEVEYRGPELNRRMNEDSYIRIRPHENVEAGYAVNTWYPTGEAVQIALRRNTFRLKIGGRELSVAHHCGSGVLEAGSADVGQVTEALLEPYPTCTTTQKAQINNAIDGAMRAASLAVQDYENANVHPILTWFGSWSLGPWEAYARMLTEDELVRCGSQGKPCTGNLGVVVDYFFDEKLYMCAPVWNAPFASLMEWNQQVGVLIHELAHFVDQPAGNIVDWDNPNCTYQPDPDEQPKCYGWEDSLYLATCTRCAQRNADNYKFFAMQAFMRAPLFAAVF